MTIVGIVSRLYFPTFFKYNRIYIYIYMYMDALVSRYLTSPSMGVVACSIGRSLQRVVVGGARVSEGGDGEGWGREGG